jgi:hypothetical protein
MQGMLKKKRKEKKKTIGIEPNESNDAKYKMKERKYISIYRYICIVK